MNRFVVVACGMAVWGWLVLCSVRVVLFCLCHLGRLWGGLFGGVRILWRVVLERFGSIVWLTFVGLVVSGWLKSVMAFFFVYYRTFYSLS